MKKVVASISIVICLLLAFGGMISIDWLYDTFGDLSMDEIIFHLKVPMTGANTDLVGRYIKECLLKITIPSLILSYILIYPMINDLKIIRKIKTSEDKRTIWISLAIAILILIFGIIKVIITTDIIDYIRSQLDKSEFIANEYVAPEEVNIEFPEQKRNLIYIFLESMETTYSSKKDGGYFEYDLMPEISKIAKENINFGTNNQIGGAHVLTGSNWTAAAMTAHTLGVPLKISIGKNSMNEYRTFLEGAYGIGEVLYNNGYKNFILLGSDSEFGGRRNLFRQHGNYRVSDVNTAVEEGKEFVNTWWGYLDDKLFEFAKEKLLKLAEDGRPFNFTTLTTETHFPDGYFCKDCQNQWDQKYKNVISCSSRRVGEFVKWIQQQDFYDNTTIVIVGDHLTMKSNFLPIEEGQIYDRKVVSIIINSAVEDTNVGREFSTMDLYPTTLAALGAKIEGNKLALGVNLFSDEQTLIEKYGVKYINDELLKVSKFYDENILLKNDKLE